MHLFSHTHLLLAPFFLIYSTKFLQWFLLFISLSSVFLWLFAFVPVLTIYVRIMFSSFYFSFHYSLFRIELEKYQNPTKINK